MPLTGSWVLSGAGAAALAVERVNADKTLLPGRRLEYSWADSGCSAPQGLAAMGELLEGGSRVDAVIGPGCAAACEATSYLSEGQGIPQISYSCEAPQFSVKADHRLVGFSYPVPPHDCHSLQCAPDFPFLPCKIKSLIKILSSVLTHCGPNTKQGSSADRFHAAKQVEKDHNPGFE